MRLILANPAGLWALAGIPLVLLIHFLQEQSRKVRSSTLFLLDRVKPESVGGARFERLRNSVPLWLQLLAVMIIAWLLAEPRWIRQDSRQTVVLVLDSSVSMSAFKKETRSMLQKKLREWSGAAAHTDWHLLESGPRKPRLYTGSESGVLLEAFDKWEPSQGHHSPDAALLTGRGLVRNNEGIVIFVTDRETDVSADVVVMSAGEPVENVGFAGGEARPVLNGGGMKWSAMVKNHGRETQVREWWMEEDAGGQKNKITLEPGQSMTLEGELPPEVERMTLVLGADRFAWDDRLPLQKYQQRMVRASVRLPGASGDMIRKIFAAFDGVEMGSLTPDLVVDELGNAPDHDAVQLGGSMGENGALDPAWVAAEDHRLTRDLSWSGLLSGRPMELTMVEGDVPLLWKGNRTLALLRPGVTADGRQIQRLILNWDLAQSNAARVPALPVMLQRYVEMVRERKAEPWAGNFEVGQEIGSRKSEVGSRKSEMQLRVDGAVTVFDGRAPERPGFFEVLDGGKKWISGAAQFADVREADFRDAESFDTAERRRMESALKQSEADPWTPLWVILLAGCFIGAWAWRGKRISKSVGSESVRQYVKI